MTPGATAHSAPVASTATPRLSAFVCAHNEEANLAACLRLLRFADEIVVLLDRSTDGSAAIAHALADRVIEGVFPLEGPRRAAALAACTGDWILEVDADEHIPTQLAEEIRAAITAPRAADWYELRVDNYIGDRLVRHGWGGSFGTSAVGRLYRRGVKSWKGENVHPKIRMQGRFGGRLPTPFLHRVDTDVSDMLRRLDRYTRARAIDLRKQKRRPGLISHGFRGIRRFWKCYVLRQGFREGGWGVLIALMAGLYPFLSELRARIESDPPPANEDQPRSTAPASEDAAA